MSYQAKFGPNVGLSMGYLKIEACWGRTLGWGMPDPLQICLSPTGIIMPNLISIGQKYKYVWISTRKLDSPSFKFIWHHQNW